MKLAVQRAGRRKFTASLLRNTLNEIQDSYKEITGLSYLYVKDIAKKPKIVAKRFRALAQEMEE